MPGLQGKRVGITALLCLVVVTAAVVSIPHGASAQEAVPGDACGTTGAFRQSTGTDQTQGGYFLFCDGANWQRVISYSSTGDLELARTGAVTLPAGTDAMRPLSPLPGMIRFSSTATEFEGYDGSAWNTFGGLIDTVTGEPAPGFNFVLNDLGDVSAAAPSGGECLTWNGSAWVNSACGESLGTVAGAPAPTFNYLLDDLTDVSAAGPSSGECLTWNGANWVNGVCGSGVDIVAGQPLPSSNFLLDDLFDVDASGPSDGDVVFYSTGAAGWVAGAASASATPAGSSQQIQLNSGGAFAADANFVYTSAGDFIVGSYQLDDTGTGNEDSRMFFDVSKGAFRAGYVDSTQWNSANVANFSTALGEKVIASGTGSFAVGGYNSSSFVTTTASGSYAVAMGYGSHATGWGSFSVGGAYSPGPANFARGAYSVAMGMSNDADCSYCVAMGRWSKAYGVDSVAMGSYAIAGGSGSIAMGRYTSAGEYSMAIGLSSTDPATDPKVSGQHSLGIFMGDQTGYDLTDSNKMALIGGEFVIDSDGSSAASKGCIRFNDTNDELEYSDDCSSYTAFSGIGGSPAGSSQQIQLNSGGAFAADANFVYTSAGDFIVGSYQLDDTGTGSEDYRMFFDVSKGAFRAGSVSGNQWDGGNVGNLSFGFGANVRSSGSSSFAVGTNQVASGTNAIALGHDGVVSGSHAVGIGQATDATGTSSVSIGYWTFANANYSLVMGHEARTLGAHSFALGLGNSSTGSFPQVSGTSSFGIFMGDQQGVDITQSNAMVLMGGKFGIGDTTPDVALDVVGDIDYTGILTDVSDRRMKTDITALPGGQLEKLMALQGVSFKMKDDPEARTELGLIAQDVEAVYPALVKESGSGIKSLNYMGLIGPMIEGMRELKAENDALRARIEALEAERSQEKD